jgi:hypothetical protein
MGGGGEGQREKENVCYRLQWFRPYCHVGKLREVRVCYTMQ